MPRQMLRQHAHAGRQNPTAIASKSLPRLALPTIIARAGLRDVSRAKANVVDAASVQLQHEGIGRRNAMLMFASMTSLVGALEALCVPSPAQAGQISLRELERMFEEAIEEEEFEVADAIWSRIINLAPQNSAAWSNRGALRLQHAKWQDAQHDLAHAVQLEVAKLDNDATTAGFFGEPTRGDPLEGVDASLLNNLGNSEVALGRLGDARMHYMAASRDPALREIALANLALAEFEGGDGAGAIRQARQVLRRDPAFMDMRAALAAFLYAEGYSAEAEGEWETLQQEDAGLYSRANAVARVRSRWPPRATAALSAFLSLSSEGTARGYDLVDHTYSFPAAATAASDASNGTI